MVTEAELTESGALESYNGVVEMLYFMGDDIRNEPTIMNDYVDSATADWLAEQPGNPNLKWSKGLQMACRDIVLENGPEGIPGHVSLQSGETTEQRAAKYTLSVGNLVEARIYDPIEFSEDPDANAEEALQAYVRLLALPDEERGALFDPAMQYVGIECGCDKMKEETCCFMYADSVQDDPDLVPLGVEVVSKFNCDESTPEWSEDIAGAEYVDDDSGVEKSEGGSNKPQKHVDHTVEDFESYDDLATKIQERWTFLALQPHDWIKDISDEDAIMEA